MCLQPNSDPYFKFSLFFFFSLFVFKLMLCCDFATGMMCFQTKSCVYVWSERAPKFLPSFFKLANWKLWSWSWFRSWRCIHRHRCVQTGLFYKYNKITLACNRHSTAVCQSVRLLAFIAQLVPCVVSSHFHQPLRYSVWAAWKGACERLHCVFG